MIKNLYIGILCAILCLGMVCVNQSCRQPIETSQMQLDNQTVDTTWHYSNEGVNLQNALDSLLFSRFFPKDSMIKRDYSTVIAKYERKYIVKRNLSLSEIEEVVPCTRQEYITYYNSYIRENESSKIDTPFFHYIDQVVYRNAFRSDTTSICIVLNLARFFNAIDCDSEYAQIHWDMTQDIIDDNLFIYQRVILLFKDDAKNREIYEDFVN